MGVITLLMPLSNSELTIAILYLFGIISISDFWMPNPKNPSTSIVELPIELLNELDSFLTLQYLKWPIKLQLPQDLESGLNI